MYGDYLSLLACDAILRKWFGRSGHSRVALSEIWFFREDEERKLVAKDICVGVNQFHAFAVLLKGTVFVDSDFSLEQA
ncbi:hypothetical protein A1OK_18250 [Enterovibrio norvegicus FF-454]|uniref:Uncharacterized protein n=1 Tax=Enterovibrio norvegicus FF-454 TaxID=1185651 RepID=A0A1E5CEM6_9GAMM|nr:hypothetical protein A1OK_18250 [Enterovibrio norvegicus FF-454]